MNNAAINPYLKQYKKNQVETANPETLLILLYDAAIQFLNRAKNDLAEGNETEYRLNLVRSEKIILEFMNSLDMELGGEFAERLYALYRYYYNNLVTAGITKEVAKLDEVIRHLTNLRNTWSKAIEVSNKEKEAKLHDEYHSASELVDSEEDSTGYEDDDDEDRFESGEDDEDEEDEEDEV